MVNLSGTMLVQSHENSASRLEDNAKPDTIGDESPKLTQVDDGCIAELGPWGTDS